MNPIIFVQKKMSANHFETVYPSTDQPHSRHENGMSSSYHNPAISSKDKPVQRLIVSTEIDIAFILRTTSNVPSTRPSARPSARPFCFAKSNVANWSRYTLMLSSYFIRSSFDKDAMSTICSNFSNTDLRALKGNLCNQYIYPTFKVILTLRFLLLKTRQLQEHETELIGKRHVCVTIRQHHVRTEIALGILHLETQEKIP